MKTDAPIPAARNVSMDLLRIFAMLLVVILHVSAEKWGTLTPNDTNWIAMNFFECFSKCGVPLFFMLSGAFMLKKEIPLKQLYLKKILPLAIIYFVWSFLYAVNTAGITDIVETLKAMVKSHYHLWFIPTLIGLYMLSPVLRAIVKYDDGKNVKYLIILFFIFGIVKPTLTSLLAGNASIIKLLNTVPVELMSYSSYMIVGHYLMNMQERKFNPWLMFLGYISVVVLAAGICQIDAFNAGRPKGILYSNLNLTTFAAAVFLFLGFKNINLKCGEKMQRFITVCSGLTFGVYLLHPFVLTQLSTKLQLNAVTYNSFAAIPLNAILIALICFTVTFIMTKIPIIKRLWKL